MTTRRTLCRDPHPNSRGYSLIEVLMTLSVMAVLAFTSIELFSDSMQESKFEETRQRLERMKTAIVGDSALTENNVRTSFGYYGDIGAVPTTLSNLLTRPAKVSAWAINTTFRFGTGWNGPYLSSSSTTPNVTTDAWGRNLVYTVGETTTITSYGSDGAVGGTGYAADITVSMTTTDYRGSVYGFINTDGAPISTTATVQIFYPDGSGGVTTKNTQNITAAEKGYFTLANVPYGKRSVRFYIPNNTSPTTTIGPVVFTLDRPNLEISESALDTNP